MAICKYCNVPFQWGRSEDRWVPLVPIGEDDGLERAYQDEDGTLRAAHRLVCTSPGGAAVRVTRLARPVLPSALVGSWSSPDPETGEVVPLPEKPRKKRRRRGESSPIGDDDIPFGAGR